MAQNEVTSIDVERVLKPDEAAGFLGISKITLAQWRGRGDGPRFFRMGRTVRYRLGDVFAFRDAHTVGKVTP